MTSRGRIAAAVALTGALALPASAQAFTATYGGTADGGAKVAIDVKANKKGVVKKVIELRGQEIPITCDQSGPGQRATTTLPTAIPIDPRGRFFSEATDPEFGFRREISGKFSGNAKKIKGTFVFGGHFPATATLPEENCQSESLEFSVRLGGPDNSGNDTMPRRR